MDVLPATVAPLPKAVDYSRRLPASAAFGWLAAGWRDLWTNPGPSLLYGVFVAVMSAVIVGGMFWFGYDYILLPALAGFLVVGPVIATGLYEKSRQLEEGRRVSLGDMLRVSAKTGQIFFIGAILCGLALLWLRAAVIIYALFFGLNPFPGLDHVAQMLFTTPTGLAMLAIGSAVGGLFAAFSFAISVFAIPMLLDRKIDAFTAMGASIRLVWNNLPVMIVWGAIVVALTALGLLTATAGLIVVFPLLGHAAWHAYEAVGRPQTGLDD